MPSEGQERWLDVVEVPRVVDPEGRYVISHDSVELCKYSPILVEFVSEGKELSYILVIN